MVDMVKVRPDWLKTTLTSMLYNETKEHVPRDERLAFHHMDCQLIAENVVRLLIEEEEKDRLYRTSGFVVLVDWEKGPVKEISVRMPVTLTIYPDGTYELDRDFTMETTGYGMPCLMFTPSKTSSVYLHKLLVFSFLPEGDKVTITKERWQNKRIIG